MKYTYTVHSHLGGKFELPPLPQLKELSVIVTTIEQSGDLAYLSGLEPGHFSHIFLDEAAQVMECQALIALQLAVRRGVSTKIVLAGDHMQMEEELVSKQVGEENCFFVQSQCCVAVSFQSHYFVRILRDTFPVILLP